ncbi:MAG TPA: hypothetical protein VMY80_16625 [Anaerolineae bacterium]|nr:hypothetical protein [Anaerolineae bacterium]
MIVRVVGQQPFCLGNADQAIVGADECRRREFSSETFLVRQPGRCQKTLTTPPGLR